MAATPVEPYSESDNIDQLATPTPSENSQIVSLQHKNDTEKKSTDKEGRRLPLEDAASLDPWSRYSDLFSLVPRPSSCLYGDASHHIPIRFPGRFWLVRVGREVEITNLGSLLTISRQVWRRVPARGISSSAIDGQDIPVFLDKGELFSLVLLTIRP